MRSIANLRPQGCRARLTMASTPDEAASHKPGWRNWQTQRTQNPPIFGSWGFDPPSRHQQNKEFIVILASQLREAKSFGGCSDGCWFLVLQDRGLLVGDLLTV